MDADDSIGAIVVTGAGEKAFAAGAGEWMLGYRRVGLAGSLARHGCTRMHIHTHSLTLTPPPFPADIKEMSSLGYMDMFKRKLFGELDTLGTVRRDDLRIPRRSLP
jgi:hypothetical protein